MGVLFDRALAAKHAPFRDLVLAAMMTEAIQVSSDTSRHDYARNTANNILSLDTERTRYLDAFVWRCVNVPGVLNEVVKNGTVVSGLDKVPVLDTSIPAAVAVFWDRISNVPEPDPVPEPEA